MASSFHIPDKGSFLDSSDMYPHNYLDLYAEHTPARSVFNDILADSSELGYPLLVDNEGDTNHNDESVLDLLPWHLLSEPVYTDPLPQPQVARAPMPAPFESVSRLPSPQNVPDHSGYPQRSGHYMATPQTPSMAYSPEQEPTYAYSRPSPSMAPRTPDDLAWMTGPFIAQGLLEPQERTPAPTPRQSPIQGHDNFWNAFQFGISNEATFGGPAAHYTLHPFARYPEATYNPPFLGNLSSKAGYPFAQVNNNYVPNFSQHISVHVASPLFDKDSEGRTIEPKKLQHGGTYEHNYAYSTNHACTPTNVPLQPYEHDCRSGFSGKTDENESDCESESLSSSPSPHSHASPGCSSSLSSSGSSSRSSRSSPSRSVVSTPSSRFTLSSRESSPSDSSSSDSEDDGCSEIDEYISRVGSSAIIKREAVDSTSLKKSRLPPRSSTSNASNRNSSASPEISIDSDSDDVDEFIPAHVASSMRATQRKSASTRASVSRPIKKLKRSTSTHEMDHGEGQADPAKRFTCTFPGCRRLFTRLFNMRTHLRTHNPNQERPFVCSEPTCRKRFSRKHDMQRHEASVHRVINTSSTMVVISYCIEYAQSQKSVCLKCNKVIPNKSLRVARMERTSEKEKKKFAKFRWYHFKCFEVPEILTKIPIHLIRGQVNLLDKDKLRLEKVIKLGTGGSWGQIVEQHQKKAKEDADAAAAEAEANGTPLPAPAANMDIDSDDEEAKDFTSALTGEVDRKQERKNRKLNKLKANTAGAKVAKKGANNNNSNNNKNTKSVGGAAAAKPSKPVSAVAAAIAASKADSKKKMDQIKSKLAKK
ncbi:hypothetical protein BGZ74_010907 [Mortierella antarctica]|nr:hypothetical protein BGZ74_010907 [Mortierella antarctica]